MRNWRDNILEEFKPKVSRLTLVADPDGLLTEEGMLIGIRDRGFDLIPFDDSIAFRFAYESQYRNLWDKGQKTDLVVVLRSSENYLDKLPFDLLKAGRKLTFALHLLFPKLNYPVISGLEKAYLDSIGAAYQNYDGPLLTEKETKEFVLMHCFGVVPKLLKTPVEILKLLVSLHAKKTVLPAFLVEYLLENSSGAKASENWPLKDMFVDRDFFFRYLQKEWGNFVEASDNLKLTSVVPFENEDIRVYIDNFFVDGSLVPIEVEDKSKVPSWAMAGIINDPKADSLRRFRALTGKFSNEFLPSSGSHRDWQTAAQRWAELVVLRWEVDEQLSSIEQSQWQELQLDLEKSFGEWMQKKYASLHNLAYHQEPVMVHQIVRFLAVERKRKKTKIALLVLDGLALDQWLLLRKSLESTDKNWQFREGTVFAWVPSITSVSRQSIFAGEPPLYFPDSLETTSKEKNHWLRFWEDNGVPRQNVDLVKSLSNSSDPKLDAALNNSKLSVLGIVWNKVDDIMHGMELQTAGMHDQVRLWAKQGHLQRLLFRLHENEFAVFITADHGNVTATGIGKPREGVLAETHGERVRVYPRAEFRDEIAGKFPKASIWASNGLPAGRHVLLSGALNAFADVGNEIVCHGGIALEEILVPFVEVRRSKV